MGILVNYFENAYFTSFHYLVNRKLHWTERIFWLICIPICMGWAIYFTFTLSEAYILQKVLFYVDVNYLEFKTPFPSIILCESAVSSAKIIDVLSKHSSLNFSRQIEDIGSFNKLIFYENFEGSNLLPLNPCQQRYLDNLDPGSLECRINSLIRPLNNYSLFAREVKSTCDEIFTSCYYNNKEFPCCEYFLPLYTARGLCYASNNLNTYVNGSRKTELDFFVEATTGNMSIEIRHEFLKVHFLTVNGVPSNRVYSSNLYDTSKVSFPYVDIFLNIKEIVTEGQGVRDLKSKLRGCKYLDETENMNFYEIYSPHACDVEALSLTQYKHCNCVSHVMSTSNAENECDLRGLDCLRKKNDMILKDYTEKKLLLD